MVSHPPPPLYGVATISTRLKIIGLFCKRALQKRRYFAKETCNFKEPTTCSHPMATSHSADMWQNIRETIRIHVI